MTRCRRLCRGRCRSARYRTAAVVPAARARVQSVDWSRRLPARAAEVEPAVSALAAQELPLAIAGALGLLALSETTIMAARARLGLPVVGPEVSDWCRQLPYKARQARVAMLACCSF